MLNFFKKGLWTMDLGAQSFVTGKLINALRIIVLTVRSFIKNQCSLKASALTFYTLLSIVPVVAVAFAVAKGFGMEDFLKKWLLSTLSDQPLAAEKIITFSSNILEGARGGVIAGVGTIVLLYTTLCLLVRIESSFNDIWGVCSGRSLLRKVSDYLSLILLFPLILILTFSFSTYATAQLSEVGHYMTEISPDLRVTSVICSNLLPFWLTWFLFTFLFMVIPNTKVKFLAALVGSFVTSLLYFAVQSAYFYLQFIAAKYNAIYGGFAALPLFLIWLQISWTIILLGAETSFAFQNVASYEGEAGDVETTPAQQLFLSLKIVRLCAVNFSAVQPPFSDLDISSRLKTPILRTRRSIRHLSKAGILAQIILPDGSYAYQISVPVEKLTPVFVFRSLLGKNDPEENFDPLQNQVERLWDAAAASSANQPLNKPEIK